MIKPVNDSPSQSLMAAIINGIINTGSHALMRMDDAEMRKIPARGPLLLVFNHINSLEVPLIRARLHPRPVMGLAKAESWKNPLYRFLFPLWEAVPIERGTVDRDAFDTVLAGLAQGKILGVAPEGTRSGDGCLLQGKPGIVPLALRSGAPLISLAFWGHENYAADWKRLSRPLMQVRVGPLYRIDTHGAAMDRETRQAVTDEIMYRLAEQLPERYHGYYAGVEQVEYRFTRVVEGC